MTENAPSLADQVAKDMAYLAVVKTGEGANEAHTRLANVLASLKEGDVDPWLGRTVKTFIAKQTRWIVYLDTDLEVQWWWREVPPNRPLLSRVQAEVARVSMDSAALGSAVSKEAREQIQAYLGHAIERALSGASYSDCQKLLADADRVIAVHKAAWGRPNFFLMMVCILLSLWVARGLIEVVTLWLALHAGGIQWHSAALPYLGAASAGVFGAIVSCAYRSTSLVFEPRFTRRVVAVDAFARCVLGAGCAVMIMLLSDAGVLRDVVAARSQGALTTFLMICAGASERLLPSLLGRADAFIGSTSTTNDAEPSGTHIAAPPGSNQK